MTNIFEDYEGVKQRIIESKDHEINTLKQIIESQKQELAKLKGSKNE